MHHTNRWRQLVVASAAALFVALVGVSPTPAENHSTLKDFFFIGLKAIGLTDEGHLVRFRVGFPSFTRDIGKVKGLVGSDTALIGIDFRVQDGQLYGVGNGGGVYTINTHNAQASLVNTLTVTLSGTSFGVDFNPVADRLRIISDTGQNLAHNVNEGGTTVANSPLTYTVPPAPPVPALGVTGAAYTNNDLEPGNPTTATTLFDIDTTLDQVVIQSPPGSGILVATGKLGVDADAVTGFDIYSSLDDSVTAQNRAFAALVVQGTSGFYQINLLTGEATLLGHFDKPMVDIALPLQQ